MRYDENHKRETRARVVKAAAAAVRAEGASRVGVAEIMARELDQGKDWIEEQVGSFRELARSYLAG